MKGKQTHRLPQNPLERQFSETWENYDDVLEYVLTDDINHPQPVSKHDQEVVATVFQWLGSPVGKNFLATALGVTITKFDEFVALYGDKHSTT